MPAQLLPNVNQKFFDNNGAALAGGKLYSYVAGTTTPLATYTDEGGLTPNTNPVVLDSTGSASVWLSSSAYKFVLKDSSNNTLWTVDNVSIINAGSIDKTKIAADIAGVGLAQNGSTKALDVQVDNVTTQINVSNQVIVKTGGITINTLASSSKLEVVTKNVRDYSCPGIYQQIPQYDWSSPTILNSPLTLPPGTVNVSRWSPNGEFLAIGSASANYLVIYQLSNDVLTKLVDPGTVPGGSVNELAWSPCGDFLAIATIASPYIIIYQRSGNAFTKLADPVVIPGNASGGHFPSPKSIAFSPNSDFLAIVYRVITVGDFIILYERSGTTFTDVTTTSTITGSTQLARWSPDSRYFAAINTSTSAINIFSRADNVFSAITGPVVTSYLGSITDFAYSPDGNFFAVAVSISPYVLIFQVTSGAFSQLPNPATLPAGFAHSVSWSANSQYLTVGHNTTPFMTIYSVSGTTFTKISNPSSLPVDSLLTADWSPTKQYLATGGSTTPYIQVYKTVSTLPTNALLWIRQVPNG